MQLVGPDRFTKDPADPDKGLRTRIDRETASQEWKRCQVAGVTIDDIAEGTRKNIARIAAKGEDRAAVIAAQVQTRWAEWTKKKDQEQAGTTNNIQINLTISANAPGIIDLPER